MINAGKNSRLVHGDAAYRHNKRNANREGRFSHDPQERVKQLPVVDNGRLSGIVTLTDIINYITKKIPQMTEIKP